MDRRVFQQHIEGFPQKGSIKNITETAAFVYNLATRPLLDLVDQSAEPAPADVDEYAFAGIESAPSQLVRPRRLAASPGAFECSWMQTISSGGSPGQPANAYLVPGQVVGVHVDDGVKDDGAVDIVNMQSLTRCGYKDYTTVEKVRSRDRLTWPVTTR